MSREFDEVRMDVRRSPDSKESAKAVLNTIAAKFRQHADNPGMIRELATELESNAGRIMNDVTSGGIEDNQASVSPQEVKKAEPPKHEPKKVEPKADAAMKGATVTSGSKAVAGSHFGSATIGGKK